METILEKVADSALAPVQFGIRNIDKRSLLQKDLTSMMVLSSLAVLGMHSLSSQAWLRVLQFASGSKSQRINGSAFRSRG
jgi:hypothetical protein